MLALKILIYASVNCGFSGVASLKLALVIQFSGEHKAKKRVPQTIWAPFLYREKLLLQQLLNLCLQLLAAQRYSDNLAC